MISVICDDDGVWCRALSKSLGGHVFHANDLETALQLTKEMRPNVILLDVVLPDGIGWEAIPDFRAASPHTEIVVVTAHGRCCDAIRAVGEFGAFAYLDKSEGTRAINEVAREAFIASLVSCAAARHAAVRHPSPASPLKRSA